MKIDDFKYKDGAISKIKQYSIFPLEYHPNGVDKYVFDMKESYVHNYLPRFKAMRYDKYYPTEGEIETKPKITQEENKPIIPCVCTETSLQSQNAITRNKAITDITSQPVIQAETKKCLKDKRKERLEKQAHETLTYENRENPKKLTISSSPYYTRKGNKSTTTFNLAGSSILKPIHQCNRNSLLTSNYEKKKYNDDYFKSYDLLRKSINNSHSPQKYKEDTLGFTVKNVPKVPLKEKFVPTNTFRLFDTKLKTCVNQEFEKENEKLTKCLNDYDTLTSFPKLPSLLNQNQIRNVNYRPLGKSMGEKYDPHNYRNDILKSRVKRNEIGTKLH